MSCAGNSQPILIETFLGGSFARVVLKIVVRADPGKKKGDFYFILINLYLPNIQGVFRGRS